MCPIIIGILQFAIIVNGFLGARGQPPVAGDPNQVKRGDGILSGFMLSAQNFGTSGLNILDFAALVLIIVLVTITGIAIFRYCYRRPKHEDIECRKERDYIYEHGRMNTRPGKWFYRSKSEHCQRDLTINKPSIPRLGQPFYSMSDNINPAFKAEVDKLGVKLEYRQQRLPKDSDLAGIDYISPRFSKPRHQQDIAGIHKQQRYQQDISGVHKQQMYKQSGQKDSCYRQSGQKDRFYKQSGQNDGFSISFHAQSGRQAPDNYDNECRTVGVQTGYMNKIPRKPVVRQPPPSQEKPSGMNRMPSPRRQTKQVTPRGRQRSKRPKVSTSTQTPRWTVLSDTSIASSVDLIDETQTPVPPLRLHQLPPDYIDKPHYHVKEYVQDAGKSGTSYKTTAKGLRKPADSTPRPQQVKQWVGDRGSQYKSTEKGMRKPAYSTPRPEQMTQLDKVNGNKQASRKGCFDKNDMSDNITSADRTDFSAKTAATAGAKPRPTGKQIDQSQSSKPTVPEKPKARTSPPPMTAPPRGMDDTPPLEKRRMSTPPKDKYFESDNQNFVNVSKHSIPGSLTLVSSPKHSIPGSQTLVSSPKHSITGSQTLVISPKHSIPGSQTLVSSPKHSIPGSQTLVSSPKHSIPGSKTLVSSPKHSIPGSQTLVSSPKHSIPCSRTLVSSPKHSIPGSQTLVRSPKHSIPGSQTLVSSPKHSTPGSQILVSSPMHSIPGSQTLVSSPKRSIPGSQTLVSSPKHSILGSQTLVSSPKHSIPGSQTLVISPKHSIPGIQTFVRSTKHNIPDHGRSISPVTGEVDRVTKWSVESFSQKTLDGVALESIASVISGNPSNTYSHTKQDGSSRVSKCSIETISKTPLNLTIPKDTIRQAYPCGLERQPENFSIEFGNEKLLLEPKSMSRLSKCSEFPSKTPLNLEMSKSKSVASQRSDLAQKSDFRNRSRGGDHMTHTKHDGWSPGNSNNVSETECIGTGLLIQSQANSDINSTIGLLETPQRKYSQHTPSITDIAQLNATVVLSKSPHNSTEFNASIRDRNLDEDKQPETVNMERGQSNDNSLRSTAFETPVGPAFVAEEAELHLIDADTMSEAPTYYTFASFQLKDEKTAVPQSSERYRHISTTENNFLMTKTIENDKNEIFTPRKRVVGYIPTPSPRHLDNLARPAVSPMERHYPHHPHPPFEQDTRYADTRAQLTPSDVENSDNRAQPSQMGYMREQKVGNSDNRAPPSPLGYMRQQEVGNSDNRAPLSPMGYMRQQEVRNREFSLQPISIQRVYAPTPFSTAQKIQDLPPPPRFEYQPASFSIDNAYKDARFEARSEARSKTRNIHHDTRFQPGNTGAPAPSPFEQPRQNKLENNHLPPPPQSMQRGYAHIPLSVGQQHRKVSSPQGRSNHLAPTPFRKTLDAFHQNDNIQNDARLQSGYMHTETCLQNGDIHNQENLGIHNQDNRGPLKRASAQSNVSLAKSKHSNISVVNTVSSFSSQGETPNYQKLSEELFSRENCYSRTGNIPSHMRQCDGKPPDTHRPGLSGANTDIHMRQYDGKPPHTHRPGLSGISTDINYRSEDACSIGQVSQVTGYFNYMMNKPRHGNVEQTFDVQRYNALPSQPCDTSKPQDVRSLADFIMSTFEEQQKSNSPIRGERLKQANYGHSPNQMILNFADRRRQMKPKIPPKPWYLAQCYAQYIRNAKNGNKFPPPPPSLLPMTLEESQENSTQHMNRSGRSSAEGNDSREPHNIKSSSDLPPYPT